MPRDMQRIGLDEPDIAIKPAAENMLASAQGA